MKKAAAGMIPPSCIGDVETHTPADEQLSSSGSLHEQQPGERHLPPAREPPPLKDRFPSSCRPCAPPAPLPSVSSSACWPGRRATPPSPEAQCGTPFPKVAPEPSSTEYRHKKFSTTRTTLSALRTTPLKGNAHNPGRCPGLGPRQRPGNRLPAQHAGKQPFRSVTGAAHANPVLPLPSSTAGRASLSLRRRHRFRPRWLSLRQFLKTLAHRRQPPRHLVSVSGRFFPSVKRSMEQSGPRTPSPPSPLRVRKTPPSPRLASRLSPSFDSEQCSQRTSTPSPAGNSRSLTSTRSQRGSPPSTSGASIRTST